MAQLQLPRGEAAVEIQVDETTRKMAGFSKVWTAFFAAVAKRFNAVNGVEPISAPAASDAPVAYSQAQQAEVVLLVNELRAKVDAIAVALKQ
jgi:hypothetical protein